MLDPSPSPEQNQQERDHRWLQVAVDLARRCPPTTTALSVGAVVVDGNGTLLATGFSRETDPHVHAEEAALAKLNSSDPRLPTSTMYSSVEPCGTRRFQTRPCADLIVAAGIRRVVYAWREPAVFVSRPFGVERLQAAGVEVIQIPAFSGQARSLNAHLLDLGADV